MRRYALALILIGILDLPAQAQLDAVISGVRYAQNQAYQAFMKLKVIEEIRILKENYDSSMRYYDEFKRLNSGKGLFYNVSTQIKSAGKELDYEMQSQIDRDFIHTYRTDTQVDQFFQGVNRKIANNMKYAGDELANLISNRKMGQDIAQNASGLSPKDAANLSAKAQGIQLQVLVQLHEDNVRLIELQTLRLANETRRLEQERQVIQDIRTSVQSRVPGAFKEAP